MAPIAVVPHPKPEKDVSYVAAPAPHRACAGRHRSCGRSCPCSLRLMLRDFCQSVWVGRSSRLSVLKTCFHPLLQPSWPSHSYTFPVSPPIVPLSSRLLRLWLWPRWDPEQEHFAQRPHPISEPRGHGGRTGPPLLSRARAVGRPRLRQWLAQGGMRQAEIIVHVI